MADNNGSRVPSESRPAYLDKFFEERDQRINDPALENAGVAPNYGQYALPHLLTYQSLHGSFSRAYRPADEALRHSFENARFMRNDPGVMECIEARQRSVALLDWHLEPEDDNSAEQAELCAQITKILEKIVRFTEYRNNCLHAIWYGKYGIQNRYGWENVSGNMRLMPVPHREDPGWMPINGDKLVFRYDDGELRPDRPPYQLGIRVGHRKHIGSKINQHWTVEPTGRGLAYFLPDYERKSFVVHKHMIEDGAYEDNWSGEQIHGVGVRSRIYWDWFQKQESLAFLMEYLERSAGGIEIWTYPAGDATALNKSKEAAKERLSNSKNVIFFPKPMGDDGNMYDIQVIEPGMAGIESLKEILQTYYGHRIKRYILGQVLSSEAEATGLGSGVAELHFNTFLQIVKYDAVNLEETLTRELVRPIQDWNFPKSRGIDIRFKIETESPDVEKKLEAYRAAWEMGAKLRESDVIEMIGAGIPDPDDSVLQNPQIAQAEQQAAMGGMDPMQQMMGGMGPNQRGETPPTSVGFSGADQMVDDLAQELYGEPDGTPGGSVAYVDESGEWQEREMPEFDTGDRAREGNVDRFQKIDSAGTSLNQVPALFKAVAKAGGWKRGHKNLDIGGGKYDKGTKWLAQRGVQNLVYDPYNRDQKQNGQALSVASKGVQTATLANVLNVIDDPKDQIKTLQIAKKALGKDGVLYIDVHEGDGSGKGKATSRGYQQNKKLADYLPLVQKVFPQAEVSGGIIVASSGSAKYARMLGNLSEVARYQRTVSKYGQLTFQWDEDAHPRDEDGKFAEKEGGGPNGAAPSSNSPDGGIKQIMAELEANSLGIPRHDMPQIVREHQEKFLGALRAQGVGIKEVSRPVSELKGTQKELNEDKVAGMSEKIRAEGDLKAAPPVLASSDGYILDGHHRWAAYRNVDPGKSMDLIEVDMPIERLLDESYAFDDVQFAGVQHQNPVGKPKAKPSKADVETYPELTRDDLNNTLGYLKIESAESVASYIGAPDDATVTIGGSEHYMVADIKGDGYKARRFIARNADGQIEITNHSLNVDPGRQGEGIGTRMLAKQVDYAAEMGAARIKATAARQDDLGMIGYKVWPRLGYDAPFDPSSSKYEGTIDSPEIREARTLQDLMKTKAGRQWWDKYGDDTDVEFDLSEGSKSRRVLDKYLRWKHAQGKLSEEYSRRGWRGLYAAGSEAPDEKPGESPDFTEDDLTDLEEFWDDMDGNDYVHEEEEASKYAKWEEDKHPRDESGQFAHQQQVDNLRDDDLLQGDDHYQTLSDFFNHPFYAKTSDPEDVGWIYADALGQIDGSTHKNSLRGALIKAHRNWSTKRQKEKTENMLQTVGDSTVVQFVNEHGQQIIVHPSSRQGYDTDPENKWQMSFIDPEGRPSGHTMFKNRDAALASAIGTSYWGESHGPAYGGRNYKLQSARGGSQGTQQYARKKPHKDQKSMFEYDDSRGDWITIGGAAEGDKKHSGGTPVQVKDGMIMTGPAELEGKTLDSIDKDKRTHSDDDRKNDKFVDPAQFDTFDDYVAELDKRLGRPIITPGGGNRAQVEENWRKAQEKKQKPLDKLEALRSIEEQADSVPSIVKNQLERLQGIRKAIDAAATMGKRYEDEAIDNRQKEIDDAMATIEMFREKAPGNDVDAEAVLEHWGGLPDFTKHGWHEGSDVTTPIPTSGKLQAELEKVERAYDSEEQLAAPDWASMSGDELVDTINKTQNIFAPGDPIVEDWSSGRGQGKRSGYMVQGAMGDPPRGKKTYRGNPFENVPEYQNDPEVKSELDAMRTSGPDHNAELFEQGYLKARSAGLDHDAAVMFGMGRAEYKGAEYLQSHLAGLSSEEQEAQAVRDRQAAQSPWHKQADENYGQHANRLIDAHSAGEEVPEDLLNEAAAFAKVGLTPRNTSDLVEFNANDIPLDLAIQAHSGTSFVPERRGRQRQQDYANHMRAVVEELEPLATTPEQRELLSEELARYRDNYKSRYMDMLHADSRTMSSMITGPARFPTARNEKRLRSAMNKYEQLQEFQKKAQNSIRRKLMNARTPEQKTTAATNQLLRGVSHSVEILKGIHEGSERMRGYNPAAFRNSVKGKIQRAANNGEYEAVKKTLEELAKIQGTGVPIFAKNNSIWNAHNVAKRNQIQNNAASQSDGGMVEYGDSGAEIFENRADDRVQIGFPGKPDEGIRNALKSEGWRWSPRNSVWQRKLTANATASAKRIMQRAYGEPTSDTTGQSSPQASFVEDPPIDVPTARTKRRTKNSMRASMLRDVSRYFRQSEPDRYQWVTIGSEKSNPPGEKGGTPVFIGDSGTIEKGPDNLKGKDLDNLDQNKEQSNFDMSNWQSKRKELETDYEDARRQIIEAAQSGDQQGMQEARDRANAAHSALRDHRASVPSADVPIEQNATEGESGPSESPEVQAAREKLEAAERRNNRLKNATWADPAIRDDAARNVSRARTALNQAQQAAEQKEQNSTRGNEETDSEIPEKPKWMLKRERATPRWFNPKKKQLQLFDPYADPEPENAPEPAVSELPGAQEPLQRLRQGKHSQYVGATQMDVGALAADPNRFQYKISGIDPTTGTTAELKEVKQFNPMFGGQLLVWHDPEDGQTYVVNGHHRYELASRSPQSDDWAGEMSVYFVDAPNAQQARALGALANIAEGRGTATDAAKFMRDSGSSLDDLSQSGISLKGRVASDAGHLSGLSETAFHQLTTGMMSESRALAIGANLTDHDKQNRLLQMVRKREDDGKRLNDSTVAEMARMLDVVPKKEGGGGGLFGDDFAEDLLAERGELVASVRRALAGEARTFKDASSSRRGSALESTGTNVIDTEGNRSRAREAAVANEDFNQRVNWKGDPLAELFNEYSQKLADNPRKAKTVKNELLERARAILSGDSGDAGATEVVAESGSSGALGGGFGARSPTAAAAEQFSRLASGLKDRYGLTDAELNEALEHYMKRSR